VPSDQLASLESTLATQASSLATLTKQKESLQADIDALKPTVGEYKDKLTEYKEKCKDVKQKKSDLDQYVSTKGPMLEAAVKDKKPQILQCIAGVDNWIAQWEQYAQTLDAQATRAESDSTTAAARAVTAQQAYDAIKNSLTDLGTVLDGLKATRQEIEAEEEKDQKLKTSRMYVLFLDLLKSLSGVKIRTPEEFEQDLCAAWTELSTAKSAARDAAAAAATARQAAKDAATTRDANRAKRRDKIFTCIDALCGSKTPPPAGTGYAAPAATA